uniref:Uncharacterized protein n=1 Tax=Triticum urartu TaxID=4572 RepID=A0A8R7PIT1_TRIUA
MSALPTLKSSSIPDLRDRACTAAPRGRLNPSVAAVRSADRENRSTATSAVRMSPNSSSASSYLPSSTRPDSTVFHEDTSRSSIPSNTLRASSKRPHLTYMPRSALATRREPPEYRPLAASAWTWVPSRGLPLRMQAVRRPTKVYSVGATPARRMLRKSAAAADTGEPSRAWPEMSAL